MASSSESSWMITLPWYPYRPVITGTDEALSKRKQWANFRHSSEQLYLRKPVSCFLLSNIVIVPWIANLEPVCNIRNIRRTGPGLLLLLLLLLVLFFRTAREAGKHSICEDRPFADR